MAVLQILHRQLILALEQAAEELEAQDLTVTQVQLPLLEV